jgi:hypothetical protein
MPHSTRPDESPRDRILEAEARALELGERLARLRAGEPVSPADLDHALLAAQESLQRSAAAHVRAGTAHRQAAEAHRSAARLAEHAGHQHRAEEHLAAAVADDEAGDLDDLAAEADGGAP